MKVCTTSARLKQILEERNIKQVDILNAAKPFCQQYGIKLAKNDLSQYVSGKVVPKQEKLTVLGLALNVSEAWLMGYDVSPLRDASNLEKGKAPTETSEREVSDDDIKFALFGGSGEITDAMYQEVKDFAALVKLREDIKKSKE